MSFRKSLCKQIISRCVNSEVKNYIKKKNADAGSDDAKMFNDLVYPNINDISYKFFRRKNKS